VLLHDAVRPLVSPRIITECFEALATYDAVDVAIPSADTIIEVDDDNVIAAIPPRARLRRGQTPQAFRAATLRRAYDLAEQDPDFTATDDCSVVLRYTPDVPIWVVVGEERNMKVTDPIDVYLADKLFQLTSADLPTTRDEAGYREALAGKTMVVFGGSYGIGSDMAAFAREHGADVFTFSRSATNTHVENREDIRRAATDVLAATGRVDYVVNTAAILPRGLLTETTEETVWAATEINYVAPVLLAQEFHPHLRATRGSLLYFTSSSYTRGRSGYSLYSSAKAAVVNLTQALADEWSADGISVNCINPERTGTPMRTKAFGEEPPGSLLESTEVARKSLDVLISGETGLIIDVRRDDPLSPKATLVDEVEEEPEPAP
jgi:NAD(P)-dependent dehydrogenase (short-subunit alcohol dehydrogenase family)